VVASAVDSDKDKKVANLKQPEKAESKGDDNFEEIADDAKDHHDDDDPNSEKQT